MDVSVVNPTTFERADVVYFVCGDRNAWEIYTILTFWVNSKTALTVFYSVLKQAKVRLLRRVTSAVRSCSLDVIGVCISEGQYVRKERCLLL